MAHLFPQLNNSPAANAALIAAFALDSYSDDHTTLRTHVRWCGGKTKPWRLGAARGCSYEFANDLLISIAGTDQDSDWLYNLDVSAVYLSEIEKNYGLTVSKYVNRNQRVHSGMASHAMLAHCAAKEALWGIYDTVWLTGHSLGGAAASIMAAFLHARCRVFSFGAPRCVKGNVLLCRDITRVCRSWDIVPDLPKCWGHPESRPLYVSYAGNVRAKRTLLSRLLRLYYVLMGDLTGHSMTLYARDCGPLRALGARAHV